MVPQEDAHELGLGRISGLENHIRHYRHGRDLAQVSRNLMVIDLDGLTINEVRERFPEVYQWLYERVKPERDLNRERYRRENWWLFGRKNTELRAGLRGINRFISTPETAKHRFFVFLAASILPDNMLINIALDDAYYLGVLSSFIHKIWVTANAGSLGVYIGNVRYNKTRCFDTFPFPDATDEQKARIRGLGEALDAHRKRQQSLNDKLTLTDMYNVLEKLRSGESLTAKEQDIHEKGLISVLKQIHDDLDAAVLDAYGWPKGVSDEEILERLVTLNAERATEERQGKIRWLRPEFQNPHGTEQAQTVLEEKTIATEKGIKTKRPAWPSSLVAQAQAVRSALQELDVPATPQMVARNFTRARVDRVTELLETLASLGQVRQLEDETFVIQ